MTKIVAAIALAALLGGDRDRSAFTRQVGDDRAAQWVDSRTDDGVLVELDRRGRRGASLVVRNTRSAAVTLDVSVVVYCEPKTSSGPRSEVVVENHSAPIPARASRVWLVPCPTDAHVVASAFAAGDLAAKVDRPGEVGHRHAVEERAVR